MNKSEIAFYFSKGNFEECFEYLTEDTFWEIPGEQILKGKTEIVAFCLKTKAYFDRVTTEFNQLNMIENEQSVAINGTAKFIKNNKLVNQVSSCDVYTFDENNNIRSIYSYCITTLQKLN